MRLHFGGTERRGENPIWLTIYGDMVTNLMLFFLMLFVLSRMGPEERKEMREGIQEKFSSGRERRAKQEIFIIEKKTEDSLTKWMTKSGLDEIASINVTEEKIKIRLRDPVLFLPASAVLKSESHNILDEIGEILRDIPNQITVEGYTDDRPLSRAAPFKDNWELSASRAFSVIKLLMDKYDIPASRLSAVGYGDHRPIAPNDTPENRALNRRIEINIAKRS
ncbi:MAG TPA: flagellar motor protein MotB [bacterium]|nr:flagellar motor protein MotB [bacterium]